MNNKTGVVRVRIAFFTVALFLAATAGPSRLYAAPEFFGLGMPAGASQSLAYDVSADGSVVVGTAGGGAFRWTPETGSVALGEVFSLYGVSVSADGATVVAGGWGGAFRWTQTKGRELIEQNNTGYFFSAATAISDDGNTIVGMLDGPQNYQTARWTPQTGLQTLGNFIGGGSAGLVGVAYDVSADGTVIVGHAPSRKEPRDTRYSVTEEAFRWTEAEGLQSLGDLSGGLCWSLARAIAADGNVIVGESQSDQGQNAFRWTAESGTVSLGKLGGAGMGSRARDTSGNGSIIVGHSGPEAPNLELVIEDSKAFIWDQENGMRELQQVLANDFGLGAALTGWKLLTATAISRDGGTIVGYGVSPNATREAWVARIPIAEVTPINSWTLNGNGNWFVASSWTSGVPNGVGKEALLGNIITQPRTLTLNFPVTLGRLDFDNAHSYTIAGTRALTFDATTGAAKVNVVSGSHTISAPVTLAENTEFTVTPAAGNLSLTGTLNASGKSLTKAGAGTLTLSNLRAEALAIDSGTLAIAANGTSAATSVLGNISIAGSATPTARLDLNNNAAIIDHTGTSPAAIVRQQILAGRGGPGLGQPWNGNGITSSAVAAANATEPESRSIAYAENSALPLGLFTTFRGQPVDGTALLIAYTRTGDANLDGLVNDDDVSIVGARYAPGVSQPHWALGDFDYNGFVDDDDVTLLGAFYDPSATALSPPAELGAEVSAVAAVAAVPEPQSWVLALMAAAIACGSRSVRLRQRR
jgi:probable HAF family extracellular repeat protein